jgi:hypothetical protein
MPCQFFPQGAFGRSGASPPNLSRTCHASLPLIRISRFICPVSGINDFVRGTPQFDESIGEKSFAINPDAGLVSVKDYRDYFVAAA